MGEKKITARKPDVILGVIPARGGSKGIPRKNIVSVNGKPLLAYTIEAARQSRGLTSFVLTTDSEEIRELGLELGAPAPYLRPAALGGDKVSTLDVVRHAVEMYEKKTGQTVTATVLLQPTAPLRETADIDASIDLLRRYPAAHSVVSFYEASHAHPNYMYELKKEWMKPFLGARAKPFAPRQTFSPVYVRNGSLYATRRKTLFEKKSLAGDKIIPYIMPRERSVNIDTGFDLWLAERVLETKHAPSPWNVSIQGLR